MPSPICERAIEDALKVGKALIKILATNDVKGRSHQYGYYLPKPIWKEFTTVAPVKGVNDFTKVDVTWQDGRVTHSKVTWYGASKSEYRLTCFQDDFPYREAEAMGNMLVLVIKSHTEFAGYTLDLPDDMEEVLSRLGVEMIDRNWALFDKSKLAPPETENQCVERQFRKMVADLEKFPSTNVFSDKTREVLLDCVKGFQSKTADQQLVMLMDSEYALFKLAERQLCQNELLKLQGDVDGYLKTAMSMFQRRKSRAGYSLENHFGFILRNAKIPFVTRSKDIEGRPDVIIPSVEKYKDKSYPTSSLFMVGVKTTCKDRWRQICREASRLEVKHLLTLQQSISKAQLMEMKDAGVTLVVPEGIKKQYPKDSGAEILSVQEFIDRVTGNLKAS